MFSAFNPSKCTHLEQWAADCAAPGEQSWTSCRSRDSNPQPWVTSGFKSNALSTRPRLPCSRARSSPGTHRVRSRAPHQSGSPQSPLQSPLQSGSPQSPLDQAHGLLFGAMCSVKCAPPILKSVPSHLVTSSFFSVAPPVSLVTFLVCHPIYSPGVCSPLLIHCCMSCVLCLPTLQLSACLFFPRWVFFVHLFNLIIKRKTSSCTWVLSSSVLVHHDK